MEGMCVRGYMHLYMGLFDNTILFGRQSGSLLIGESLLQFIYADFKSLESRSHYSIEDFKTFHPYFSYCDPLWQNAFLKHLEHPDEESPMPNLKELTALQDKYMSLLLSLYNHSTGYDKHCLEKNLISDTWIQAASCFCRMSVTVTEANDNALCMEEYFVTSLEECLFLELIEILKRRIVFKTCKNCGRLFIPKRTNMDYCSRIYTSDGKTCSEVGYTQTFARNVKNDELLLAYTRAYKAHYARMTKPRKKTANMTREEFEAWYQEAKRKLEQARAGLMDPETFKAWLKE